MQILQESVQKLLPSGNHSVAQLPNVAIFAMAATIVIKGIIWIGCIPIKTTQVQALAQGELVSQSWGIMADLDRLQNRCFLQHTFTLVSSYWT